MAGLEIRSVKSPDETRQFAGRGHADVVTVDGHPLLYATFEPGWRWSENVKPIAGTESCQAPHLLYCLAGRMKVVMDDGTEAAPPLSSAASLSDRLRRFKSSRCRRS
jgi:hypothetical protein